MWYLLTYTQIDTMSISIYHHAGVVLPTMFMFHSYHRYTSCNAKSIYTEQYHCLYLFCYFLTMHTVMVTVKEHQHLILKKHIGTIWQNKISFTYIKVELGRHFMYYITKMYSV
jgi:hypothetical protein